MTRLLALALLLAPAAGAQAAYDVTLPLDGATGAARDALLRGVELLHSFEYDDARDAFVEAQRLDPLNVMAVWGEAMTHNHPVWQRQDTEAGRDALARIDSLAPVRLARGRSMAADRARQDSYLAAVGALFREVEDMGKDDRDDVYLGHMARHAERYPDDLDGRAFYALALLGSAHEGRDYAVYERAADVAQGVLGESPEHPGALHYLIHAYDDPDHAALALPAARAYSEIVSAASHALHMPTHIYFALGLWEEASALNVRAFEAARDASARRGEPLNNHGWHALYWLNYSELQLGRDRSALAWLDTAVTRYHADSSSLALRHLVRMRAQTAVTLTLTSLTPDGPHVDLAPLWLSVGLDLPVEDADPSTRAADLVMLTMLTSPEGADSIYPRVQSILDDPAASPLARASATMVPASAEVGADHEAFTRQLVAAAELVEATPVSFGPPLPALFPHEFLLLTGYASDDPELARCLIGAVDARSPNRRIAELLRPNPDPASTQEGGSSRELWPSFCSGG